MEEVVVVKGELVVMGWVAVKGEKAVKVSVAVKGTKVKLIQA